MRKISLWAKNNPRTARVYIILIKILLAAIAWIVSRLLFAMDIILPGSLGVSALLVFFLAAMLYPSKDRTILTRKYFYIKQKSCDFTLAACTFVMMVSIINNQQYRIAATALHASSSITSNKTPTAEEILTSLNYRDKKTLTKQEKRILKQEFKKQLHVFTKAILAGDKKKSDQTGWIILTIVAAIGLTLLLSALVCSISCGGADGLALAVGIIGLAAIIWGTVVVIKNIKRKEAKKVADKKT